MAYYDLNAVRAAATRGAIDHLGRRAAFDCSALSEVGVSFQKCIANLEEGDFDETEDYGVGAGPAGGYFDVYKLKWCVGDSIFPLYIKLKLVVNREGERVLLASFHQNR